MVAECRGVDSLCTGVLLYDSYFLQEFLDQHNYCKEKFFDSQYKEWFERLEYDGTVKNSAKGTPWKCAFHLVRALVFTLEAFSEMEAV